MGQKQQNYANNSEKELKQSLKLKYNQRDR